FHTGDMGILDPDGYLYLKGRIKAMFMAPNGLNIYPEAIEAEINSNQYIAESMVLQRQGKLVAMVYPDFNHSFVRNLADSPQLETFIKMQLTPINENLPDYQQLSDIEMLRNGFEKTPKGTIKRYLYQ
nr:long-chain fatty acid--CoA ligase [Bacteroidales bacterium]